MKQRRLIHKIKIISIIIVVAIISSCKKELVESPKSVIDPNNFYKSADQVNMIFSRCLNTFYNGWGGQYPWVNRTVFQHTDQERDGNLVITENTGSTMWTAHYNSIMNLNFAIKSIKNGSLEKESQKTQDELMGMAKCLRAWNYHHLVQMFGDVPILTEDTEDYFTALPGRSSVKDVYDLIVSDYNAAIGSLPPNPGQVGHPNQDVAKALLAKAYLCMASYPLNDASNWTKAADLTKEIIQSGRYSLVDDIDRVFSNETETGPEMMWSFIGNEKHQSISPQVWSSMNGWGDIGVDPAWADRFPEQPRKEAYLEVHNLLTGEYYKDIGRNPGIKKMLYAADFRTSVSTGNIPVIRYADVLLMYAEALNMANSGPTQEAVDAVNKVISRANGYEENPAYPLATTSMSKDDFDELVIDERNWELCFELGDRWFDLVRKRILYKYSKETDKPNFTEDDYLFPIPEQDSRLNPNLTQNPGYPTYN